MESVVSSFAPWLISSSTTATWPLSLHAWSTAIANTGMPCPVVVSLTSAPASISSCTRSRSPSRDASNRFLRLISSR